MYKSGNLCFHICVGRFTRLAWIRSDFSMHNTLQSIVWSLGVILLCDNVCSVLAFRCLMEVYGSVWVHTDASRMLMNTYRCIRMRMYDGIAYDSTLIAITEHDRYYVL